MLPAGGSQQEADGFLGVVRDGKRFHGDIPDLKGGAGLEDPAIQAHAGLIFDGFLVGRFAKNGQAQFPGQRGKALDVIRVFMGDEDAGQVFGNPADGRQPADGSGGD